MKNLNSFIVLPNLEKHQAINQVSKDMNLAPASLAISCGLQCRNMSPVWQINPCPCQENVQKGKASL